MGESASSSRPGAESVDHGWSADDRRDIARELSGRIEGEVRFGLHDRMLYATDASIYQQEPLGVVIPASIDDALGAIDFCRQHGLPVLPRGGGTSLAGQATARAVVLDFSPACNRLIDLDPANRCATVEPGLTIDGLNRLARPTGLFFAPDPSTSAQANIGGCVGNNAAGAHSILYGRTTENLLGLRVALADGRVVSLDEGAAMRDPVAASLTSEVARIVRPIAPVIRERFPRTRRRNAGYALDTFLDQLEAGGGGFERVNLAHLLCGSEGTLAVTLGATVRLHPIPGAKGLAVAAFATLDEAIEAVVPILGLGPAAVELLDDTVVNLARGNITHRGAVGLLPRPGGQEPAAVLYVEFFAGGEREIHDRFAALADLLPRAAIGTHTAPADMARAWELRKAGEPLLHGLPGERKPLGFVEDNAVPPERLAEFVRRFRAIVAREGTRAAFYAHASVGVLHVRPLLDLHDPEDRLRMERIATDACDLARELGGVMSGEHGDGKSRGPLLERHFGPEVMRAFRAVKAVFDPMNLLNPGNIVEPGPLASIHQGTRADGMDRARAIPTYFSYDDQTDFSHAVEMCNGAGVCRKKTGGVMCPSYMATLDERHSTRGRGNALRLAISGQLNLIDPGRPLWDDPETLETLDLCLSCKACKSECPSNVDIARLKSEYLAQSYQATGGVPLKARAFGHIDRLFRLAGLAPGPVNAVNRSRPGRAVLNALLGLHPRRSLPTFQTPLHRQWAAPGTDPPDRPVVVLYADTFTSYTEPRIGLEARRLLEAFGYSVVLYRGGDAARALISVGLLPEAITAADTELVRLGPAVADPAVRAVLFLEPSVLSAVTDDWMQLDLATPRERRRALVAKASLVEDFIHRAWDTHPARPTLSPPAADVIFHGHCHQRALWGHATSTAALHRVYPGRVRVLDTTCCGMAGSFGYTKDRYGLSMRIGELGLLPACREAPPDALIVAPGVSCRHQIHDGAARRALHPVEALALGLGPRP